MVEIFKIITQATRKMKDAPASEQLEYASKTLASKSNSGSANLYADGLAKAAEAYRGKSVTSDNAMELVSALMGSKPQEQAPAENENALGGLASSLLSGVLGNNQQSSAGGQDMLGSLLSGVLGGSEQHAQDSQQGQQEGLDANDLLQAGMAFLQAKQEGATPGQAILSAIMPNNAMSDSEHREQSGSVVVDTILQLVGSMGKKKK